MLVPKLRRFALFVIMPEEEVDIQLEMMSGPQGPQMQMIQDMSETIEALSKFPSNFTRNI